MSSEHVFQPTAIMEPRDTIAGQSQPDQKLEHGLGKWALKKHICFFFPRLSTVVGQLDHGSRTVSRKDLGSAAFFPTRSLVRDSPSQSCLPRAQRMLSHSFWCLGQPVRCVQCVVWLQYLCDWNLWLVVDRLV